MSRSGPSSGTRFHSLQATSQALQPMQTEVSVKNPIRGPAVIAPLLPARARARWPSTSSTRAGPRGRRPGRTSQVLALDSMMWTLGSPTIGSRSLAPSPVASPLRAPVVGQADLVDDLAADPQGPQPLGDQHPGLDRRPGGDDRRPAAVDQAPQPGQLRADLAEHLRLELGQVAEGAAHPPGGVVLGEPVGGEHERVDRRPGPGSGGCRAGRRSPSAGCSGARTAGWRPATRAARSGSAAARRPGRWARTASPCRRPASRTGSCRPGPARPPRPRAGRSRGRWSPRNRGCRGRSSGPAPRPTRRSACAPTRAGRRGRPRPGCRGCAGCRARPSPTRARPSSARTRACGGRPG